MAKKSVSVSQAGDKSVNASTHTHTHVIGIHLAQRHAKVQILFI